MGDLDLRRLRYFLAVAETLNYGRAAERLRIAQPALSRSITTLERELGVTLLDRSRAGTRLTPAGELLRDEGRELLRAASGLQRRVRQDGVLTIGFMPGMILTPVVRHLEERFPGLRVEVVRTSWTEQIAAVRDGRFDACFAHRPFDATGLRVVELFTEQRVVGLPVAHPLAGKDTLSAADLADEELLQPAGAVPGWPGAEPTHCGPAAPVMEEKFEWVGAGRGIVIVPESAARYYRRPDLAFVPVPDLPPAEACLVTDARRRSPVLDALTAHAVSAPGGAGPVLDDTP